MTPSATIPPATILLVGNYAPDAQQSMARFTALVQRGLSARGIPNEVLTPPPFLSRLAGPYGYRGLPKWLGYADKFVLFPSRLRRRVHALARSALPGGRVVVHVTDHSNAMYAAAIRDVPTLVTCHDLLAVRGALGEATDCPASASGRRLQRWILRSLARARHVACVSATTHADLLRLLPGLPKAASSVVPNGLNHPYRALPAAETTRRLGSLGLGLARPYLLHVGSNLPRKNKPAVLHAAALAAARGLDADVVFAGPALPAELHDLATRLGRAERLRNVVRPDEDTLEALYNGAHALLFPSRWEGFGWPILEAQACGCPVVCGDQSSLPEVAGDAALLAPPDDHAALATALLRLRDPEFRRQLVTRGFALAARHSGESMLDAYLALYTRLTHAPAPAR